MNPLNPGVPRPPSLAALGELPSHDLASLVALRDQRLASASADAAAFAAWVAAQHDAAGAPPAALRAAWRVALAAALASGQLPLARAAGQQVQLLAAEAGALDEIGQVAAQVAALAARAGDVDALVFIRCEAALSAAERGEPVDLATLEAALDDETVGPRTQLRAQRVVGELRALAGDLPGARVALRKALMRGNAFTDGSVDPELAHAAYLLGTLCVGHQPDEARQAWTFTVALAFKLRQWPLYRAAVLQLMHAWPEDDALGAKLVAEARARLPEDVLNALLATLEAELGAQRVAAWLAR